MYRVAFIYKGGMTTFTIRGDRGAAILAAGSFRRAYAEGQSGRLTARSRIGCSDEYTVAEDEAMLAIERRALAFIGAPLIASI